VQPVITSPDLLLLSGVLARYYQYLLQGGGHLPHWLLNNWHLWPNEHLLCLCNWCSERPSRLSTVPPALNVSISTWIPTDASAVNKVEMNESPLDIPVTPPFHSTVHLKLNCSTKPFHCSVWTLLTLQTTHRPEFPPWTAAVYSNSWDTGWTVSVTVKSLILITNSVKVG